jgi:hypothetical protein
MITFPCSCGQTLQVQDEFAGRKIRCPKCQAVATAPLSEAIEAVPVNVVPPPVPSEFTEHPRPRLEPAASRDRQTGPEEDRPRRRRRDGDDEDAREERDRPRRRARPTTSGKALAGMILGLATFLVPLFCAIPAVILSILGMSDIRRNPGKLTGTGLAITGIITGLLGNVSIFGYLGIRSAVRTSAERVELTNNLKQIGLAMHLYHDTNRAFPPAGIPGQFGLDQPNSRPNLSWRVALLPYLEEGNLYNQFNFNEPWDGPNNIKLLPRMPRVYAPLGRQPSQPYTTYMQVFTGPNTPFRNNQGMRVTGFTDGTSNTILVAEAGEAVPWTKPADMEFTMNGPLPKLGAFDARGFFVLMADGSVRFVRRGNDMGVRWAVCPDDGQPLPLDWDLGR